MKRNLCLVGAGAAIAIFSVSVGHGLVATEYSGRLPDSWPKQLRQAKLPVRTIRVGHRIVETVYEIEFDKREDFERMWPHILKLADKGSRLILHDSPSTYDVTGTSMKAGVRILCPDRGKVKFPDGRVLLIGPPWPRSVRSFSGALPEYVIARNGRWVPYASQDPRAAGYRRYRARVDVVLVVDGNIVDLNRIHLPKRVTLVDKRKQAPKEAGGPKRERK